MISGAQPALMFALSGVMRSGASRSGYVDDVVYITIGGGGTGPGATRRVLHAGLMIHDALNEVPNTCTFTVRGTRPIEGATIAIARGSVNNATQLFAGSIIRSTQATLGQKPASPAHLVWYVEGIDYTWQVSQKLVTARYRALSASVIAADLVAQWAPGFSSAGVAAGLPAVDEITYTNVPVVEALARLADRIGGYANVGYDKRVSLWLEDPGQAPGPVWMGPGSPCEALTAIGDLSPIVTRAIVEGGGASAAAPAAVNATEIVIEDPAWYSVTGGRVATGPQRPTYTGVQAGGAGSSVGPGVTPAAAPALAGLTGSGVTPGAHQYAYTWVTAGGETRPGPAAAVTLAPLTAPTTVPLFGGYRALILSPPNPGLGYVGGGTARYAVLYSFDNVIPQAGAVCSALGPASAPVTLVYEKINGVWDSIQTVYISVPPAGSDLNCRYGWIYISCGGGPFYYTEGFYNPPGAPGGMIETRGPVTQPSGPYAPPTPAGLGRVALSAIAAGPAAVTARKLYRTAAGAGVLKLLTTLADNVTTTYTDAIADAALGAAAPANDTSGLQPSAAIVPAGAASMLLSGVSGFPAAGWIRVAGQAVRYSGITGNTLTGIPALGQPGALVNSVAYGQFVITLAALTGVAGVLWPVLQGDPVNVLVIVDDGPAQTALAAYLGGGDGIAEGYWRDERVSEREARNLAYAQLALRRDRVVTVQYRTRDPLTRSGPLVYVNLAAPQSVVGSVRVQHVTWRSRGTTGRLVADVVASSTRFTLADLLRRRRAEG